MQITNFSTVIICAFRYALGRSSYVVNQIVTEIHNNWKYLREADQDLIVREIQAHKEKFGKIGHDIDEREWMTIVERYNEENGLQIRNN